MSSSNFLVVDGQPLSLAKAFHYLQVAGKFQSLLLEILSQHIIQQELQVQPDLTLSPAMLEQVVIDFRVGHELTDPQDFQICLDHHGIGYEAFRQQYAWQLTCERLKTRLSQPGLGTLMNQESGLLSQPEAVSISVENYFPLDVRTDELVNYAGLPEEVRDAIAQVQPETVTKPIPLDDYWYVFRVETLLPTELNEALVAQLRDEIFAQWLNERVSAISVKLEVN